PTGDFSVKCCILHAGQGKRRAKKSASTAEGARRSSSHSLAPFAIIHLQRIFIIHYYFLFCKRFPPHTTYRKKAGGTYDLFLRPRPHGAAHTGAAHGAEADAGKAG